MTTTEDETNWLPFTVRRKPCCTSANVIVVGERDPIIGAGRALPHKGLSALQPGKNSKASRSALSGGQKTLIRFIRHRTLGDLRECTKGTSISADKLWRCAMSGWASGVTCAMAIYGQLTSATASGAPVTESSSLTGSNPPPHFPVQEPSKNRAAADDDQVFMPWVVSL
jgi:hypothetical protein